MGAGIKLEPMSLELFLASTMQAALEAKKRGSDDGATVAEMVRQLDADEYWSGRFAAYTFGRKCDYVRRKMQTVKTDGRRAFYTFRRRK